MADGGPRMTIPTQLVLRALLEDPGSSFGLDGQGRVGDVDGDGLSGLCPAEGDLLPGDQDDASGGRAALDGDRLR